MIHRSKQSVALSLSSFPHTRLHEEPLLPVKTDSAILMEDKFDLGPLCIAEQQSTSVAAAKHATHSSIEKQEGAVVSRATPLGIALIPDIDGLHYVTKLNQAIHELHPSEFVLKDQGTLLPHVSLFQGQFEDHQFSNLFGAVIETWGQWGRPIYAKSNGLNLWLNKIFFLDLEISSELVGLQRSIIELTDPLRSCQFGSADPQKLIGLNAREQRSIDKYAYPFADDAFRPHFTVGRMEQTNEQRDLRPWLEVNPIPKEFCFERIVVFDVGMFGRLEGLRLSMP
jgi:hypothetical protein